MGSAQQRGSAALEVLGRGVMTQVRREVHVNSSGTRRLERAIPRAAQNGNTLHRRVLVATDEEPRRSSRQHRCDVVSEGAERGLVNDANAPQADVVSLGIGATRLQRRGIAQTDQIGERRRDAVAGDIRVGVRIEQGDTGADESRDDAALRVGHRQEGRAAQEKGMMRHHHVERLPITGRTGDSLVRDGRGGIEGQEDRPHGRGRVANDKANAIP